MGTKRDARFCVIFASSASVVGVCDVHGTSCEQDPGNHKIGRSKTSEIMFPFKRERKFHVNRVWIFVGPQALLGPCWGHSFVGPCWALGPVGAIHLLGPVLGHSFGPVGAI